MSRSPLKVVTVLGTRPEIVRLSRTIALLDATPGIEHVLVHTGQNYDPHLSDVFFADLGVRRPDHHLGIDTSTLGRSIAGIIAGSERVFLDERPDAVLILGDTNSSMSALIARRMKIPIFHMEAGNRSFDANVPEEVNRRVVDHVADVNLVYSEHARRHLLAEGIPARSILLTGSPMREVLEHAREGIEASTIHATLGTAPGRYFVASLHREENVDDPRRLERLVSMLVDLARDEAVPVIVSTHPRTRGRLAEYGLASSGGPSHAAEPSGVTFVAPLGYFDYVRLQRDARCTVSDSGTIAEEAAILGCPAVTPRDSIERPEALDVGCVVATGTDPADVRRGIDFVVAASGERRRSGRAWPIPDAYSIDDTSHRVVAAIVGLTHLVHRWTGIRSRWNDRT